MVNEPSNPNSIKALVLLHKAMLTGQLLFTVLAFYLAYSNIFLATWQNQERLLEISAIIFSAAGVIGGNSIFKKRMLLIREMKGTVLEKFAAYRLACIIQWALIEGACLFCVICFLLVGNYAFLALAGALILYFTILAPSRMKIAIQLQFNEREMAQL